MGRIEDYVAPIEDYVRPTEDDVGLIEGHVWPTEDHVGPIGDYVGPIGSHPKCSRMHRYKGSGYSVTNRKPGNPARVFAVIYLGRDKVRWTIA